MAGQIRPMFHMTNNSGLFRTRQELEGREGAWPVGGNRFRSADGDWVPLYEGKMVQALDHRAASVVVNPENQHRPAQPQPATLEQHKNRTGFPIRSFGSKRPHAAGRRRVAGFLALKKLPPRQMSGHSFRRCSRPSLSGTRFHF